MSYLYSDFSCVLVCMCVCLCKPVCLFLSLPVYVPSSVCLSVCLRIFLCLFYFVCNNYFIILFSWALFLEVFHFLPSRSAISVQHVPPFFSFYHFLHFIHVIPWSWMLGQEATQWDMNCAQQERVEGLMRLGIEQDFSVWINEGSTVLLLQKRK